MLSVWGQFFICIGVIWAAGVRLSRYGDVIAERAGLSRSWVGLLLLATVTSLPELVTGISAVALAQVPDIAVGNILGACVFNLTLIVLLDFLHRGESVYTRASQGHILSAGFGVIMIGFLGFNLLVAERGAALAIAHLGIYNPVMALLYFLALRTVFRYERAQQSALREEIADRYPDVTLRQAAWRYGLAGLVVIGAGIWLPFIGEQLGAVMGWHATFVGTLFIALATTFPEMVVTVTALRLGALDMAIGNLFGSNLFNMVILVVDDAFFLPGPILAHVSPLHAVSAVSAMMMTGVAVIGLLYRPATRLFGVVGWLSLALLTLYILNALMLFL